MSHDVPVCEMGLSACHEVGLFRKSVFLPAVYLGGRGFLHAQKPGSVYGVEGSKEELTSGVLPWGCSLTFWGLESLELVATPSLADRKGPQESQNPAHPSRGL